MRIEGDIPPIEKIDPVNPSHNEKRKDAESDNEAPQENNVEDSKPDDFDRRIAKKREGGDLYA